MEKRLEEYQKRESGDIFNPLLKEIAQIYSDYLPLFEDEELSPKARGNLDSLFEQLEDILLDYDARVFRTSVGEKRELPRMSKISRSVCIALFASILPSRKIVSVLFSSSISSSRITDLSPTIPLGAFNCALITQSL